MELREAIKIAAEIATRPATERGLALTAIEDWLVGKERSSTMMVWFRRDEAARLRASLGIHIIDGRKIVAYRDPSGEWAAYDDNYGPEASSLYGHGRSEIEAIEECVDALLDYEADRFAATVKAAFPEESAP